MKIVLFLFGITNYYPYIAEQSKTNIMIYTHENITLNVSTLNYVDMMGETVLNLDSSLVAELIENSCNFSEWFLQFECDELYAELEEDEDAIIKYFTELDEVVEVRNADAIIAVYEYCLDEDERQFNLDVETENVSWVIHDMLHAIHDASGCTIYVESAIERERILKSLEITKEQFPNEVPNYEFLEKLETEFHTRFKEYLDLDEFKYDYEYEEEEEEYI